MTSKHLGRAPGFKHPEIMKLRSSLTKTRQSLAVLASNYSRDVQERMKKIARLEEQIAEIVAAEENDK